MYTKPEVNIIQKALEDLAGQLETKSITASEYEAKVNRILGIKGDKLQEVANEDLPKKHRKWSDQEL